MKFFKRMFATALVAAVTIAGSADRCYAWTSGSSSGLFQHYGTQERAVVKIWVTNGNPTELEAYVQTSQQYKGGTKMITCHGSDYNESTYSAVAGSNAGGDYRIVSYSGYANVKGVRTENVMTTRV